MSENKGLKAKLQLISSMTIFGTIGLFVRYLPFSSGVIAMVRGIIGAIFLLLVLFCKRQKPDYAGIKRNALWLGISGVAIGVNWIVLFEAYRYTTIATATLCYYLAPVLVILASPFIFKEKITLRKGICVLFALFGIFLVSGVQNGIGGGIHDFYGILLGIAAAFLYACAVTVNKLMKEIDAFSQTFVQLFLAGVVLIPYNALMGDLSKINEQATPFGIALLLFVGIVHTGISYTLYFTSSHTLPAQTLALFSYIDPVVAIFLSAFILHENMDIYGIIGAILVLGSTFLSEISPKRHA